ncbi:MAG: c-type cytochrome [Pyrinomonadaceae bacterium]
MRYQTPLRLLVMALFVLLPLYAQEKKDEAAHSKLPDPTNLKVLKASTGAEVAQIMRTFTAGLGVQCNHCHVEGNFASDDNPKKEVARRMIKLTRTINDDFSDRKMHVSCYTCHRSEIEPKTAPGQ